MGNESLAHLEIKKQASNFLKAKGFKDSEIYEEYKIGGIPRGYIIDVVGISSSKNIAIEAGNCDKLKIAVLKGEIGSIEIKFDEVIHIPYSEAQLRSEFYDEESDNLRESKKFLIATYNEEVYGRLKEDTDFKFQKCIGIDDPNFKIGRFSSWLIPPTATGTTGEQLQYEINFCLVHDSGNDFRITINAETNNAVKPFLQQMKLKENKEAILKRLHELPDNCCIQTGYKYKTRKRRMPPLPRNWEDTEPYKCNTLIIEELEEIISYLEFYLDNGSNFEQYPVVAIVDADVRKEDMASMIKLLKKLYKLLFTMDTLDLKTAKELTKIPKFGWYVDESKYDMLLEEARDVFPDMEMSKLKRLVRIIKKCKSVGGIND